jgi:CRISPR/Cas system-associated exonuclease Cas4 (RecB family)
MSNVEILERYGLIAKRPEVIDSSMMKDYVDCPSRFYLRHVLGLKKIVRDPSYDAKFDWGTVWHRVMENWWGTWDQVEALKGLDPWPDSIQPETDKHARSKERMIKIFFEYVEKYEERDKRDFEILRNEQFFDVFNDELGLRWCGRMDILLRRKRNKNVVVWDHKTTSAMGDRYFDQYEFSFQLPGYVWAANQIFTESVAEVGLDVLYTLKASHQFFRRTFRYTPAQLAEWQRNVRRWLDEMNYMLDNHLHDPEAWKKNWNECTRYGNCTFTGVHFTTPESDTRLRILSNDYEIERWDPRRLDED